MAKPNEFELIDGTPIRILHEDRSVIAIDKPPGWWLDHESRDTGRNLHRELYLQITAGEFWAKSRGIRFLRYIHRLDAGTSGVLLLAKSLGAISTYSELFAEGRMEKTYLAVTQGLPRQKSWACDLPIAPDPSRTGAQMTSPEGKEAFTEFEVLATSGSNALIEARPKTGRTHQIRVHLAAARCPILGDRFYGGCEGDEDWRRDEDAIGLRATSLRYRDPFTRKPVWVRATVESFLRTFGFEGFRPGRSDPSKDPKDAPPPSGAGTMPKP